MDKNKLSKVGHAIGYISGLILAGCVVAMVVALTIFAIMKLFGGV